MHLFKTDVPLAIEMTNSENRVSGNKILLGICAALAIAAFIPYIPSVIAGPLLDEQFLISWLKNCSQLAGANSLTGLLLWSGPEPADSWGPVTSLSLYLIQLISLGLVPIMRLACLFFHLVTTILVFLVTRKLTAESVPGLAVAASLLFAFFPLHAEAVAWLGGSACLLATMFFMASLYCYLKLKENGDGSRIWLGSSLVLYFLSIASASYMWLGAILLLTLEIMDKLWPQSGEHGEDFVRALIRTAPFLVLATLGLAIAQLMQTSPVSQFNPSDATAIIQNLFFPINQANWHKYSRAYTFLYIVLAPAAIFTVASLFRKSAGRRLLVLSLIWLIITALPFAGSAVYETDLYGERLLYLASVPFSMLMASMLLSARSLAGNAPWQKWPAWIISGALVSLVAVFYFCHLWNETSSYRNAARSLRHIQKSIEFVHLKSNDPYVFAREIPEYVSIYPSFSEMEVVCFDGKTQLLSAPYLPGGRMIGLLDEPAYLNNLVRWNKDLGDLVPLAINKKDNLFGTTIEGGALLYKIRPAIEFYSTARFDDKENCIIMESNSQAGPAISLKGEGLSNSAGEFFWVEAKVLTPLSAEHARMQFHWLSGLHNDYEKRDRSMSVPIVTNDGRRHRYYIPLRTSGWYSNGQPTTLTLGFPAGAKVWLYGMGVESPDRRLPSLTFADTVSADDADRRYNHPFYNFPNLPELGTMTVKPGTKSISFNYDLSAVAGAETGMVEISKANQKFNNPNGTAPSGCTLLIDTVQKAKGSYNLSLQRLEDPGVYSIRIIGMDKSGTVVGSFCDSLQFLKGREW